MKTILFLRKNKMDISESQVTITASDGEEYVDLVRNRVNTSGWITTGSIDADNTAFTVDFANNVDLNFIALVKHNFKAYTIKYWDGASFVNFSTPISETTNTVDTKYHEFTTVTTSKIQLIIQGTMIANSDKYLAQFIATEKIGRLAGWPTIKKPILSRERVKTKMISGKLSVKEQIGNFTCELDVKVLSDDDDLTIFEELYFENYGFLVWLCGGDQTQFSTVRKGYRLEDFYLMKCVNEYSPEYYEGLYKSGNVVQIQLAEVVD